MNAAYRAFTGDPDVMGLSYRDAFPGLAGQPLHDMLDRVYATGQPESRTEWRAQIGLVGLVPETPVGLDEVYADFTVIPRRDTDGAVNGLLVIANDVTNRVAQRRRPSYRRQRQAPSDRPQQRAAPPSASQQARGEPGGGQRAGGGGDRRGPAGRTAADRPAGPAAGQDRGPVPGRRAGAVGRR